MDITYVILHTQFHKNRQHFQESTWLGGKKHIYYSDHEDVNVLKVTDDTSYQSAEVKFVNIFNELPDKYMSEWLCFADNDTYINTINLERYTETADKSSIHGQMINSWPNDPSLYYPSGGAGFLIHQSVYIKLRGLMMFQNSGYSDVTFGLNLRRLKQSLCDPHLFFSWPPHKYGHNEDRIREHISYHYINSLEEMSWLTNLSKSV